MNWYKKAKDKLPGGLADKKAPSDFDTNQIEKGKKIEMEHTNDKELAKEIAMDHLEEFPTYYTELEKIEQPAENNQPKQKYIDQLMEEYNEKDVCIGA